MKASGSRNGAVAGAPARVHWNLRTLTMLLIFCVIIWPWPRPQRHDADARPAARHGARTAKRGESANGGIFVFDFGGRFTREFATPDLREARRDHAASDSQAAIVISLGLRASAWRETEPARASAFLAPFWDGARRGLEGGRNGARLRRSFRSRAAPRELVSRLRQFEDGRCLHAAPLRPRLRGCCRGGGRCDNRRPRQVARAAQRYRPRNRRRRHQAHTQPMGHPPPSVIAIIRTGGGGAAAARSTRQVRQDCSRGTACARRGARRTRRQPRGRFAGGGQRRRSRAVGMGHRVQPGVPMAQAVPRGAPPPPLPLLMPLLLP